MKVLMSSGRNCAIADIDGEDPNVALHALSEFAEFSVHPLHGL